MDRPSLLFILGFFAAFSVLSFVHVRAQTTLILSATLHDQSPRHFPWVDFERPEPIPPEDHGIAQPTLNLTTRKPIYSFGNSPSVNKTVSNGSSYYTFFSDSYWTKLVYLNLTLTQSTPPNVYEFTNFNYFPVDGQGWDVPQGSDEYTASDGLQHNFHFCLDVHGRFAYQGGETFYFLGDDDVWVFINNQLIVDLGGPHTKQSAQFSLDAVAAQYGMTTGNNYRFDFFYCERHTTQSEIELSTSLQIYCSYYDWCDVCDGDGQSCCQPGDCNDNNPCTEDLCAILVPPSVGCEFLPINCTAPDICHTAYCSQSAGGCVTENITCPVDTNLCTIEQCVASQGGCIAPAKVCEDNMGACTIKSCNSTTGNCVFTPVVCNDNNACTADTCNPSVTSGSPCVFTPILCSASNACNISSCSTTLGCQFAPKNCNDNNACTTDGCSNGQCTNVQITCPGNQCNTAGCSTSTGCYTTAVNCNDNNACTTDSCINSTGCSYQQISCDDGNACTLDQCNPASGCNHTAIVCNDGNDCTYDSCSSSTGCTYTPKNCNDNMACTADSCGPSNDPTSSQYCLHTLINCQGNNNCTVYGCNNATGCTTQPLPCTTTNPCGVATCSAATGCSITVLPQSECNVCYNPVADFIYNCSNTDLCAPQRCYNNAGSPACEFYANVTCNDNNACTTDSCVSTTGQCDFVPIPCDPQNACYTAQCNTTSGACVQTPLDCNDGNPCTADSCSNGNCVNTLISSGCTPCGTGLCNTTNFCNPVECTSTTGSGTCSQQNITCNDNNACTNDACVVNGAWNTSCTHVAVNCTQSLISSNPNPCNPALCDSVKGCYLQPVNCNDNNNCTADSCIVNSQGNAQCQNLVICPTSNACFPNVCFPNNASCATEPVNCNDGNPCTVDSCSNSTGLAQCFNIPVQCNVTNQCFPGFCNSTTGLCGNTTVNCDDGILCTIDSCNSQTGLCSHVLNPCDDNNNCTVDSCNNNTPNSTTGCVHTPVVCQTSLCTSSTCDPATGCVYTPVSCPLGNTTNYCQSATCDDTIGCFNSTRICVLSQEKSDPSHWTDPYPNLWNSQGVKSNDCFKATCDYVTQKCVISEVTPWTSYCGAAYLTQAQRAAIISTGAIVGVTIAAVIFAALAGFGGKKGYDAWVRMKDEKMGAANTNPMYAESKGSGNNALYG